mmetsp:Transcript_12639/g.26625  ORF Transcript_12639/g.26625 Transcript_12639/m.26625 type:complete len:200 (+) Transcript_12639:2029-2628(+)
MDVIVIAVAVVVAVVVVHRIGCHDTATAIATFTFVVQSKVCVFHPVIKTLVHFFHGVGKVCQVVDQGGPDLANGRLVDPGTGVEPLRAGAAGGIERGRGSGNLVDGQLPGKDRIILVGVGNGVVVVVRVIDAARDIEMRFGNFGRLLVGPERLRMATVGTLLFGLVVVVVAVVISRRNIKIIVHHHRYIYIIAGGKIVV